MITIRNRFFSMEQICASGQCFRMDACGRDRYSLVAFGRYLEIAENDGNISFDCSQEEFDAVWRDYFDLDRDYERILSSIDPEDSYLVAAATYARGVRILRQELWETIVSFIISQQNNIKRIRRCIRLLCETYGEERTAADGTAYHVFPTAFALAAASEDDLRACGLGYRSRYIRETASMVVHKEIDLDSLYGMDCKAAKSELLRLCGVGTKVADCICLFALRQADAFPKDTHINKVLAAQYPEGFPYERYAGCSGILQQYMFYYDLSGPEQILAGQI